LHRSSGPSLHTVRPRLLLSILFLATWVAEFEAAAQSRPRPRTRPVAPASAPAPAPAPPRPAVGSIRGELSLTMRDGTVQRFADSRVRLVPAAALRAAAELCTAHDSASARHRHLRRDARVAADSAVRGSRERTAYWQALADSLAVGIPDAQARRTATGSALVRLLDTHPEYPTGPTAEYSIRDVPPGPYHLYAAPDGEHYWLVPVTVPPADTTVDLSHRNAQLAQMSLPESIAQSACWHSMRLAAQQVAGADSVSVVETTPSILNRIELGRHLERRYPRLLRDAGVTGQVLLRFRILADGTVDPYSIEVDSATHPAFADQAALAAETIRFAPARVNGQPVPTWVTLPLSFKLPP
jgi:TonB family protein